MRDEELLEPFAVQEIFVNGFTNHQRHDGVMSCVGYRATRDGKLVVVRLVWPAANTEAAIEDAKAALAAAEVTLENSGECKRGVH